MLRFTNAIQYMLYFILTIVLQRTKTRIYFIIQDMTTVSTLDSTGDELLEKESIICDLTKVPNTMVDQHLPKFLCASLSWQNVYPLMVVIMVNNKKPGVLVI